MNTLLMNDFKNEKFVLYFNSVEELHECYEIWRANGGERVHTWQMHEWKEELFRSWQPPRAIRWDGGAYNSTTVYSYTHDNWFSRIKYAISSTDFLKYMKTNISPELVYSKAVYKRNTI